MNTVIINVVSVVPTRTYAGHPPILKEMLLELQEKTVLKLPKR